LVWESTSEYHTQRDFKYQSRDVMIVTYNNLKLRGNIVKKLLAIVATILISSYNLNIVIDSFRIFEINTTIIAQKE